ncbi:MAG: WD40 repeat domain-containing protein [Planctomycetes bacterium]|nr:WD40 repeat domain-containing protein [Planctomycetota bacterium]MBI5778478.1 WD40 repeat domain-containing protein [Planctomycetota bacterium]
MRKAYFYTCLLIVLASFTAFVLQCAAQAKDNKKPASSGTWREIRTIKGNQFLIRSLAFAPDSKTLASASDEKVIKIWDVTGGLELNRLAGHKDIIWSVVFSPDGKMLASGGDDRTVKLWDPMKNKILTSLKISAEVWSVAFSPNSRMLASGDRACTITLFDVPTATAKSGQLEAKELKILQGHSADIFGLAFSPDNKLLASGSHDNTVKIWDIESGECLHTLTGHRHLTYTVAFSPDGKMVASGSFDKTVKLWNVETGEEIRTLQGHEGQIRVVAFSPDGTVLASGAEDGTAKIWESATGKRLQNITVHQPSWVHGLAFSPDGRYLATSDYGIKIWEFIPGK